MEERNRERDKDLYSHEGGIEETSLNKIANVLERHNMSHQHNVVTSSTLLRTCDHFTRRSCFHVDLMSLATIKRALSLKLPDIFARFYRNLDFLGRF